MHVQAEPIVTREAEFAGPAWMFGSRSYQVLPDGRSALYCLQPFETDLTKDALPVYDQLLGFTLHTIQLNSAW